MPDVADQPTKRSRRASHLLVLADLGVLVHVLSGAYLAYYFGRYWMRTGWPMMPLGDVPVALWPVIVAYFVASFGLLVGWLITLQRSRGLGGVRKWAWAFGMCFIPLVGIAYHVRFFRVALRKGGS